MKKPGPAVLSLGALLIEDFDETGVTVLDEPEDEGATVGTTGTAPHPPVDLEAVRAEAFAAGVRSRDDADAQRRTEAVAELAATLTARLEEAFASFRSDAEQSAEAVVKAMLASLHAAMPALCARFGGGEAAAVARVVLPNLAGEPQVTLRHHPAIAADLAETVAGLDPELRERVQLCPSESIPVGDVRIAWSGGTAVRDTRAVLHSLAEALAVLGLIDQPEQLDDALHLRREDA
ncbi:MAG: hypothetical protein JOY70_01755 [Acidisphaera sp.]|nr:hypothetical protein [Acidisphaera sp.]MBV9813434.1 hypothetical protein [Acetobacteraceae bacterium]